MTATRIRETADGVLYRLSEAVEYWRVYYDMGKTVYVVVRRWRGVWDETHAVPSDELGEIDREAYLLRDNSIVDPDAMIEAMGYTVLQEEL